jgi:hypothetical protein
MSGLLYDGKRNANLVGFARVDWVGDFDSRRSTLGHYFTLVGGGVSWSTKRQTSTTLSSTKAKYMSFTQATKEALWLRKLFGDLGYQLVATPLYCDNQNAIALSQNPKYHTRTKHIVVQHHHIQEIVAKGEVSMIYCATKNMVVDIMTKSLPKPKHVKFTTDLGINLDDSLETKKE